MDTWQEWQDRNEEYHIPLSSFSFLHQAMNNSENGNETDSVWILLRLCDPQGRLASASDNKIRVIQVSRKAWLVWSLTLRQPEPEMTKMTNFHPHLVVIDTYVVMWWRRIEGWDQTVWWVTQARPCHYWDPAPTHEHWALTGWVPSANCQRVTVIFMSLYGHAMSN